MTSRERFFATVRHERPDRVPLDLWVRPEMMRALQEHLGTEDVCEALGIDFASRGIREHHPEFEKKCNGTLEGDMPYAGGRYIFHDERTFETAWGIVFRVGEDGKLVEWVRGPLVDAEDPDEFDWPGASALAGPESIRDQVAQLQQAGKVVGAGCAMPFKIAWHMRGMENLLCDMAINLPFVEKLYDRIYAFQTEKACRAAAAGVDVIHVVGDIAMQDRLMFSPQFFRDIDKPRLAEMVRKVRQVKPDILFFYHSDGNMMEVVQDFLDVGFDIINPIQPECMDPNEVKRRWGDVLTMWGTISITTTLPKGTPESVYAEVQERIRRCGYNGGLVIAPANVIMYDTPVENVVAMYRAAREFDWEAVPAT